MTSPNPTPFAASYERPCPHCGRLFRTDAQGARYTNAKGNPRYIHPQCPAGARPGKGWKRHPEPQP